MENWFNNDTKDEDASRSVSESSTSSRSISNDGNLKYRLSDDQMLKTLGDNLKNLDDKQICRYSIPVSADNLKKIASGENILEVDNEFKVEHINLFTIMAEYSTLENFVPRGIYCLPDHNNFRDWYGVIFLRHGIYKGGVFRFKIMIDKAYPKVPPVIKFLSNVFHPLVDAVTGIVDITPKFDPWRPKCFYMVILLVYLKCIFYDSDLFSHRDNNPNSEASKLFAGDFDKFREEVSACIRKAQEELYNYDDDSVLKFSRMQSPIDSIIDTARRISVDNTISNPINTLLDWLTDDLIPRN